MVSCWYSLSLRADVVGQGNDHRVPFRCGIDRMIVVRTVEGLGMTAVGEEQSHGTCFVAQSRRSVAGLGRAKLLVLGCFRVDCRCRGASRAGELEVRGADCDFG